MTVCPAVLAVSIQLSVCPHLPSPGWYAFKYHYLYCHFCVKGTDLPVACYYSYPHGVSAFQPRFVRSDMYSSWL